LRWKLTAFRLFSLARCNV